jgi:hypothetical protein
LRCDTRDSVRAAGRPFFSSASPQSAIRDPQLILKGWDLHLAKAFAILRAYADCCAPTQNPVCSVTPVRRPRLLPRSDRVYCSLAQMLFHASA